uniref:Agenet-like domain-containing protein n=1 Tax=Meloidogyne hapla TaxID=6305 RepID=A0A1I8BN59_MELHA
MVNGKDVPGTSKRKHAEKSQIEASTEYFDFEKNAPVYNFALEKRWRSYLDGREEYNDGEIVEVFYPPKLLIYLATLIKTYSSHNQKRFIAEIQIGPNEEKIINEETYYMRKALKVGQLVAVHNTNYKTKAEEFVLAKVKKINKTKYDVQFEQIPIDGKVSERYPVSLTVTKVFFVGEEVEVKDSKNGWIKAKVLKIPGGYRVPYKVEVENTKKELDIPAVKMRKIDH